MPIPNNSSKCLSGITFVIKCTFPALKRADAKKLIEQYGGKLASSVTKSTNIAIMGYDDEFTKNLEEARKKGIPITDQEGLFKFINDHDPTKKEENPKNPNDILEEKPNNQNNILEENSKNQNDILEENSKNQNDILEEKPNNQNDMLDENSKNQNDMLDEKPINNPEIKQYIECMQKLQSNLIDYLDDNNNVEEKYELLKSEIDDQKTAEDKYSLTNFLHLLSCIADNHHRESDFFSKIEQIILLIKEGIVSQFSKSEIFTIFKNNKRILLFLFTENILTFDKFIVEEIITDKYAERCYPQYFQLEMKPFLHEIKNNDEWLK
ncbi:hypothetical protein M9Y10_005891 [Tritrichomonas musculus]|uniref:BRCT domain-containing protein n=1 Tax=Tritrichomonas musculus TaxID=1915356 RepID=A0ABR2JCS8_9EUKA